MAIVPAFRRLFIMQSSLDRFFGGGAKRAATTAAGAAKKVKTEAAEPAPEPKPAESVPAEPKVAKSQPLSKPEIITNDLPYMDLATAFNKIEATTKRLEIGEICASLMASVLERAPDSLAKVTYLCINRLGPEYEGLELGLGESLLIKALAESTGRTLAFVKKEYQQTGDLGLVALSSKANQATMARPKPLTVSRVFSQLTLIAKTTGNQSQARKIDIIKGLLVACRETEAKFLVRSLEGKLRIGLAEKSVLTALAQAFLRDERRITGKTKLTSEQAEENMKEAFSRVPNYEVLINTVREHGLSELLNAVKVCPGIPLRPMLAKPTKSITEVLDRFQHEKFTCEYKYDGERAQVHCTEDGKIHVYSRNMEDMTQRYPDIAMIVPKIQKEGAKSFILDCEAVAWDREQQRILPFQVLSTRKRKDVLAGEIKISVHLFAFDALYLNGESLLHHPLSERRQCLHNHFQKLPGEFMPATALDGESTEDIQTFLDQSVKDCCEGLMVKMLHGSESTYEPSKRSRNWLKLKKDYLEGVGDSLDLVVLGAYHGKGKRTKWYGGFLLGSYNADTEEYETVCKIGTGFSEADLERFASELAPLAQQAPKSYIAHDKAQNQQPDVWFEPKIVWEVLAADFSLSPVYRAGAGELGKGVSLRFPRFIRERPDKAPEDSTSAEQLVQMYRRQASVHD